MKLSKKDIFPLSVLGAIQFVLLTLIAMIVYPGGTRLDQTTPGYSFFSNFFSDLGRLEALSGDPNILSALLFIIALSGLGLSFLGYFLIIPDVFIDTEEERRYSNIASILGKCSVVAFIGIAFAPADIFPLIHDLLVFTGFTLVAIVSGIAFLLTRNDERFSKSYTIIFLILFFVILCYGGLSLFIPTIVTETHLTIRVTTQKVVVYTLLISFLFQNYGIWKILRER